MAKLTKKAEIISKLHELVEKEAELAQTNISGEPGKDTKVTSISEDTETTDQNNVGPDKLNGEQGYEQKPSSDPSEPVAAAKSASEIDKLASDILGAIQSKMAEAQTNISGEPGKDTKVTSISEGTEKTDQNAVGPDKLNGEQGYEQKPSSDPSEPVATAKTASYDLGLAFCDALFKRAAAIEAMQKQASEAELLKEAGRRDFDTIIAQAAAELEASQLSDKQAEALGAQEFDNLYKQAQFEAVLEQNQLLQQKLASFEALHKQAADEQARFEYEQSQVKLAELIAGAIKRELTQSKPE